MTNDPGSAITDWDPFAEWRPLEECAVDDAAAVYAPRLEACPVVRTEAGYGGFWGVLGYDAVVEAALDNKTFSNAVSWYDVIRPPLESDPPEHTAYRRMLNRYFGPAEMTALEPTVRRMAVQMLEPLLGEPADFAAEFTLPLPTRVLCALLRIPDENWRLINDWSNLADHIGGRSAPGSAERAEARHELVPFLQNLIRSRSQHPGDDIVSGIITGQIQGRALGEDEIISLVMILISGGHNTTASGIGNTLLRLAKDQELQQFLREHPERIPDAIEESLRIDTPQQAMRRVARKDTELAGCPIAAGDHVHLLFGAANVDPAQWPNPEVFDLDRPGRRHVAFGRGVHLCIGAPLARLQMRVVIEEVLARTSSIRVSGQVRRPEWPRLGVAALPLTCRPS